MITKDLNLLPKYIIKQRKSRERTRMTILLSILVAVSCLALMQMLYTKTSQLHSRKQMLIQKIAEMKDAEAIESNLIAERNHLSQLQNVLTTAGKGSEEILPVLEKMESIMPKGLFFLEVNVTKDKLVIKGSAKDDTVVADFIHSMKQSERFESIFVPEITGRVKNEKDNQSSQQVNFTMNCTLKAQKGN